MKHYHMLISCIFFNQYLLCNILGYLTYVSLTSFHKKWDGLTPSHSWHTYLYLTNRPCMSKYAVHYSLCPHSVQKAQSASLAAPQAGQILAVDSSAAGVCSIEGADACSSAGASCTGGTASRSIGLPHAVQKRTPWGIIAPQLGHFSKFCVLTDAVFLGVGAPQKLQNAAPAGISAPHFSQRTTPLISWIFCLHSAIFLSDSITEPIMPEKSLS